jgi:hypothetical protein
MILGRQASEHRAGVSPVAQIRHEDSFRPIKVSLQSFHHPTITVGRPGVEFFEYDCAEPMWGISR